MPLAGRFQALPEGITGSCGAFVAAGIESSKGVVVVQNANPYIIDSMNYNRS